MSVVLSPQDRLRLSRAGLRALLVKEQGGAATGFPRSATMRLLLGTGGSRVAGATAGVALLLLLPGARKLLRAIPLSAVARLLFLRRS